MRLDNVAVRLAAITLIVILHQPARLGCCCFVIRRPTCLAKSTMSGTVAFRMSKVRQIPSKFTSAGLAINRTASVDLSPALISIYGNRKWLVS
jgi:hypothetical protein